MCGIVLIFNWLIERDICVKTDAYCSMYLFTNRLSEDVDRLFCLLAVQFRIVFVVLVGIAFKLDQVIKRVGTNENYRDG